jgi:hypothetical protein
MVAVPIADQSTSQPRSVPDAARHVVTVRKIGLARALRALAASARGIRVGPRRSCHSRATSDGQRRYLADSHGQLHATDVLAVSRSSSKNASRECA